MSGAEGSTKGNTIRVYDIDMPINKVRELIEEGSLIIGDVSDYVFNTLIGRDPDETKDSQGASVTSIEEYDRRNFLN